MQLTKKHLQKLILEEMKLMEINGDESSRRSPTQGEAQVGKKKAQDIKKDLINVSRNMTGIMVGEIPIIEFLINFIALAKEEKIDRSAIVTRLELLKTEIEKIAK
jgi:hypothetical protein